MPLSGCYFEMHAFKWQNASYGHGERAFESKDLENELFEARLLT
jgi:hypothetical protein